MGIYAGGAGAAAAAAHAKKMQEEEENMTHYTKEDLNDGWEFKIVRSNTALRSEKFLQLCEEEAQRGWELVEKFDDTRIRFKRNTSHRLNDGVAGIDPYRTKFGMADGAIIGIVLGACAAFAALVIALFFLLT